MLKLSLSAVRKGRDVGRAHRAGTATSKFAEALEIAGVGAFSHDHLTGAIEVNLAMRRLRGLDPDTSVRLPGYLESVHPDDRARIAAAVEAAHDPAGDGCFDVVHRLVRTDGEDRWVELRSRTEFEGVGAGRRAIRTIGTMTDVTETKRLELALQESQARLRTMVDNVHEFIGLITPEGKVLEANRSALNYVGAGLDDVIGKPLWETPWWRHSSSERERLKAAVERGARGVASHYETTHVSKSGVVDDVEFTLLPIRNTQEQVVRLIPEGRLVTADKKLQRHLETFNANLEAAVLMRTAQLDDTLRELNEKEARLRAIEANAVQGILTIDAKGAVESASETACRMFGYECDEVVGRDIAMLIPELDRAHAGIDSDSGTFLEEGSVSALRREVAGRRKDGILVQMDLALNLLHVQGRRVFTAMLQDVTQRKHLETALVQSRHDLRKAASDLEARSIQLASAQLALREASRLNQEILDSVNEGIAVFNRDLICIARNRFLAELSGVPNEKIVGHDLREQFPELQEHGIWHALERALSGETVTLGYPLGRYRGTQEFLPPGAERTNPSDPRIAWTWPVYHPYRNYEGAIIGVILVITDGTARKRAEDAARIEHERVRGLVQQLESAAEQERRHLSRELHDELAQLLTALRIDLGWLKKKLNPDQTALLQRASAMGQVIVRIQEAIKRIAASLRPPILDERGLAPAIQELARTFSSNTRIPCEFQCAQEEMQVPDPQITILYRAAQEALTNVAKHAKASRVAIELRRTPEAFHLSVEDDGLGMSGADRAKAQSFGLIGMRERVAAIGGVLDIISHPGDGTRIDVTLPDEAGNVERRRRVDDVPALTDPLQEQGDPYP